MSWTLVKEGAVPKINAPILIEGLPGIGNVGKITADFIVEEVKAKKIYTFFSYKLPHSVFVNDESLVDLPTLALYHKKIKDQDFLFLAGDTQPIDEEGCYTFCETVLNMMSDLKCKEIVTLGGIGLQSEPKEPKLYCTGNNKEEVQKFVKGTSIHPKLFGIVGPVIGVSGLMIGLAKSRKIPAVCFLAETFAHPMHMGIRGASEMLAILNTKYKLGMDLKDLKKEIELLETDAVRRSEQIKDITKRASLKKLSGAMKSEDVDYIG